MSRFALMFSLLIVAGCNTINQPDPLSLDTIQKSDCIGQGICNASLEIEQGAGHFTIVVKGTYHPITAASIWIDGTTYPLQPLHLETVYRKTPTGQRASMHRFSSELAIREKLEHGVRARIDADLQSYSITRPLKRPGYTDEAWHTLLAGLE